MSCLECGAALGKRQTKFCSTKCMNVYNGRVMVEKRKLTNPDRFQVCPECGENKAIRHFSLIDKNDASKGHRDVCKPCSKNKKATEKRNRSWQEDAAKHLLYCAKTRAKKAGLDFTITLEDVIIPPVCPVLGCEIIREGRETWHQAPSIDRIDNSKGYTPDNIVVVSRRANILKKDATLTEMRALVKFYDTLVTDHPGLL